MSLKRQRTETGHLIDIHQWEDALFEDYAKKAVEYYVDPETLVARKHYENPEKWLDGPIVPYSRHSSMAYKPIHVEIKEDRLGSLGQLITVRFREADTIESISWPSYDVTHLFKLEPETNTVLYTGPVIPQMLSTIQVNRKPVRAPLMCDAVTRRTIHSTVFRSAFHLTPRFLDQECTVFISSGLIGVRPEEDEMSVENIERRFGVLIEEAKVKVKAEIARTMNPPELFGDFRVS